MLYSRNIRTPNKAQTVSCRTGKPGPVRTSGAQVAAGGIGKLGLMQDLVQACCLRGADRARTGACIHAGLHLADEPPWQADRLG